jgi:hypothetical protein
VPRECRCFSAKLLMISVGERKGTPARPGGGGHVPTARQYLSRSSTPSFTLVATERVSPSIPYIPTTTVTTTNLLRVAYLTTASHIDLRDKDILLEGPTYTSSIAASLCSCKHERSRQVCAALSYYLLLPWLRPPLGHLFPAIPPSVSVPSLSILKSAE